MVETKVAPPFLLYVAFILFLDNSMFLSIIFFCSDISSIKWRVLAVSNYQKEKE